MKKITLLLGLTLSAYMSYAQQKTLTSESEVAAWVASSVQYSEVARLTQVTDKLDFTVEWDKLSGEVTGIHFAKNYYHWLQNSVINSLAQEGKSPLIQLNDDNDGQMDLSFDFATLLTKKEAKQFTEIDSYTMPTYEGDELGRKLILSNAPLETIMKLHSRDIERIYAQVTLDPDKEECTGYIYTYIDEMRRVIVDIKETPEEYKKWKPLIINGKKRTFYGIYSPEINDILTQDQVLESKSYKNIDIDKLFIRADSYDNNKTYEKVEQPATFKGGDIDKFQEWVDSKISYPKEAKELGLEGNVVAEFSIDKKGELIDIMIVSTPGYALSAHTAELLYKSPKWKPAVQHGENVNMKFRITASYKK